MFLVFFTLSVGGTHMKFRGLNIECDEDATWSYHDQYNEPCMCRECLHFRKYFPVVYPEVIKTLEQFGLDIRFPLEIMDLGFETNIGKRVYGVYFSVQGRMPVDKIEVIVDDVTLTLRNSAIATEAYANTGMKEPYFIIEVSHILLEDRMAEFYEAVNCGREIEFSYKEKHYFESRNHAQDWYIYCEETKVIQHFMSAEELLRETIIDGQNMNELWDGLRIDCIL